MPYADKAGTRLYWEAEGRGEPLLLIMGLGYTSAMWYRLRPLLARHYRTIVFDNRGVGQSEAPNGPYPIPTLAADALAVLEAAGAERAHLVGLLAGHRNLLAAWITYGPTRCRAGVGEKAKPEGLLYSQTAHPAPDRLNRAPVWCGVA